MKISIGVFSAERSMENSWLVADTVADKCAVTFLPYASLQHLTVLYKENGHKYDGIIFGGPLPYQCILESIGLLHKPHANFEIKDRDCYKMLLKILHRNKGIDISRIVTDIPEMGNLDWDEIFDGACPQLIKIPLQDYSVSLDNMYSLLLDKYQKMWRKNETDLIITRAANLADRLSMNGMAFEFLSPSVLSKVETINNLLCQIQTDMLSDYMPVSGSLIPSQALTKEQDKILDDSLQEFNRHHGMMLVIRRDECGYELSTSNDVLHDITDGYTGCLLSDFLLQHIEIPFSLGWGVGTTAIKAKQNSMRALHESMRNKNHYSYLVTDQNKLIGPLSPGKCFSVATSPDATLEKIGKELGISPTNLQKLINLQEKHGDNRFSRMDIAFYLNITPRSANRILNKLAECGGTRVIGSDQPHVKGRPMAVYEININALF